MLKKICGLTIALVVLVAAVTAGTWSFMSDTRSSSNNQILAGSLDLVTSQDGGTTWSSNPTTSILSTTTFKPGQSIPRLDAAKIFTKDIGNIDGLHMDLSFNYDTSDSPNVTGTADSGNAGKTTLVDAALNIYPNTYFNGMTITITAGQSQGDVRTISGFVQSTGTITVSSPFSYRINNTSVFSININIVDISNDDVAKSLQVTMLEWNRHDIRYYDPTYSPNVPNDGYGLDLNHDHIVDLNELMTATITSNYLTNLPGLTSSLGLNPVPSWPNYTDYVKDLNIQLMVTPGISTDYQNDGINITLTFTLRQN